MSYLENFNYRITGNENGPKVVFLHGLMGFLNNWGQIVRAMNDQYHCLVFDQRGHGKSMKPDSGYHPKDYALDLKLIIDELGWSKINLVGHSMGGRNALYFAHLFPENLESLIIEDIGPESEPGSYKYYEDLLNSVPTPFLNKEAVKIFFQDEFKKVFISKENSSTLAQFLSANIEEKSNSAGWDWRFSKSAIIQSVKEGRKEDAWNLIYNLNSRCLWIRGENSKDLSADIFTKILATNKLIQGVMIADAGHWVHSDQPEKFILALLNFLNSSIQ